MFGLQERFVVPRGCHPEAAQKSHVIPVDPRQLALPNAVVQGARVEFRERLLGNDGTAEPLQISVQTMFCSECYVQTSCEQCVRKIMRFDRSICGKLLHSNFKMGGVFSAAR